MKIFIAVARENILPLFNDVFSAMSIAITDADQNVRTATELLVKLTMVSNIQYGNTMAIIYLII